jgi:hypothetical protein
MSRGHPGTRAYSGPGRGGLIGCGRAGGSRRWRMARVVYGAEKLPLAGKPRVSNAECGDTGDYLAGGFPGVVVFVLNRSAAVVSDARMRR